MAKINHRIFRTLIIVLTVVIIVLLCILFSTKLGDVQEVKIDNVAICEEEIAEESVQSGNCGQLFTGEIQHVYVCGHLVSKDSIILSILLYKNSEDRPIYSNPVGDRFQGGWFCRKLILPSTKTGSYEIKVYLFRKIITLSTFEIK
jgi:hypothetical protein